MRKKGFVKKWLPIEELLDKGIIRLKKDIYIKIVKVKPINFNLKTELEKQAILKAYHQFFKTCNFDIQIMIQSRKENLNQPIFFMQSNMKKEDKQIKKIAQNYICYIQTLNQEKKSSSKNFFLILKENFQEKESKYKSQDLIENKKRNLQEKYLKIKEGLSHCGNQVSECSKQEIIEIMQNFFYRSEKEKDSENF